MGRKESALSLELERSMNMQVRVETFEEHLRHAGIIEIKVRICPSQGGDQNKEIQNLKEASGCI